MCTSPGKLGKCCKTYICSQNKASIQQRTSPPKVAKLAARGKKSKKIANFKEKSQGKIAKKQSQRETIINAKTQKTNRNFSRGQEADLTQPQRWENRDVQDAKGVARQHQRETFGASWNEISSLQEKICRKYSSRAEIRSCGSSGSHGVPYQYWKYSCRERLLNGATLQVPSSAVSTKRMKYILLVKKTKVWYLYYIGTLTYRRDPNVRAFRTLRCVQVLIFKSKRKHFSMLQCSAQWQSRRFALIGSWCRRYLVSERYEPSST